MYAKMLAAQKAKEGGASSADAAPEEEKKPGLGLTRPETVAPDNGTLLVFGCTNYGEMGRKVGSIGTAEMPNLLGPHRLLAGLNDTPIAAVFTGCTSAHVIALGGGGEVFAWGRNDAGQLGLGDVEVRPRPTRVSALDGKGVHAAATGKAHTLYLTSGGEVMACGASKLGACGPGAPKKAEHVAKPTLVPFGTTVVSIASGQNFNLAITEDGDVWSWGWSEFGVLGNGTDHQHNTKEGAVKLSYEAKGSPARVTKLIGQKCIHVACGQYHCVALSGEGVPFTWGNGGYGRLGHKDQQDLHTPKPLEECRAKEVSCGSASTALVGWAVLRNGTVCVGATSLFMCGRVRSASQNAWMYPKTEDELRGWALHAFDVGAAHNVFHADDAVIAWGSACTSGELGLGDGGKKSSSAPTKVDSLDGFKVAQVACGIANTVLLVEGGAKVDALPEYEPPSKGPAAPAGASEEGASNGGGKAKGKRPAEGGSAEKPKKGKK